MISHLSQELCKYKRLYVFVRVKEGANKIVS